MKDDKFYLIYKIFKNPILYFSVLMGICVILVYFFNTGCLLYPVQQTCISGIEWGIPKSEVSALNTHYQWWSKQEVVLDIVMNLRKNYIFKILIGYQIGLIDIFLIKCQIFF